MEMQFHTLNQLFAQLGLPSDDQSIDHFIERHKPIASQQKLHDLPFFSPHQRDFLQQARDTDADWSAVIDDLDCLMRQAPDIRPS